MGFWQTALAAATGSLVALAIASVVGRVLTNLEIRRSAIGRTIFDAVEQMETAARDAEERRAR